MESVDVRVLRAARDWRHESHGVLLVTVVRTWGSSPRPVGSMMVLHEDGRCVGSVSGGCIEDDLMHRYTGAKAQAQGLLRSPRPPELVRYGVSADDAHRFGLPCGGTLELLLEFVPCAAVLHQLVTHLETGQLVQRTVDCQAGTVHLAPSAKPQALAFDGAQLRHTLGPPYRLLLIGAGALAEYLATMALFNDFAVTVCDPRSEYMQTWSVAGVHLTHLMPDDAVQALQPDARTAIVALSHDPKLDDMALLQALESPAFYVGAIGSRRNTASRRQRFVEHLGASAAMMDRLRAPVGLFIGSKTPAEIAVSVMAEIIAVKNGVPLPQDMAVHTAKARLDAAAHGTDHQLLKHLQRPTETPRTRIYT